MTPDHVAIYPGSFDPITNGHVDLVKRTLREAITGKYRREHDLTYRKEDVLVSCGAKHSLYNVLQAVVNPGDEVVIPAPYWVSYSDMALLAGGVPKLIPSNEASGFRIKPEQLQAALTSRTRVFILNSPCNPTGATYSRDELLALARILEKHDCLILADDIYEKIVYEGFQVHNIVALCPALRERAIIVNGVSKTYAMTGWRIGYALGPSDVIAAAGKIQSQSTSNPTSIAQAAALEAIRGQQDEVAVMVREFHKRRDLIVDKLNAIGGIACRKPEGAFYVFPNISGLLGKTGRGKKLSSPCDLADYLLEEAQVAGVPGEDFGSHEHIRFSYATSLADIERGCERIRQAALKLN
jgi:aspartate aminotransferase